MVHIADLAHARAQELHSLLHELGQRQTKHRTALQILPRYMRRRAASYNIKRLPRSLRPLADPKTVRYASIDRSIGRVSAVGHGEDETIITVLSSSTARSARFLHQSSTKDQMVENSHLARQTFSHDDALESSPRREIHNEIDSTDLQIVTRTMPCSRKPSIGRSFVTRRCDA